MKPVIFFLTTILLFSSCNSKKNGDEIDCDYQKRQAQNNFKYGNYTWTIFMAFGYDYLGEDEFKKLLAKNNIKSKELLLSCLVSPNEKYDHCEEEEMNKLIEIKFGEKFIDSLKYITKIDFLKSIRTKFFPSSNVTRLHDSYF